MDYFLTVLEARGLFCGALALGSYPDGNLDSSFVAEAVALDWFLDLFVDSCAWNGDK